MDTNGISKKFRSSRTSDQGLSFAENIGKSVTFSCCAYGRRAECDWRHYTSLLWIFLTTALHQRFRISITHKFPIASYSSAFLSRLPSFPCVKYESDFWVGDKSISDGRLEVTLDKREKFWRFWHAYFKTFGIDSYLEEVDFQTKTRVTIGFAGHVKNEATAVENRYKL